MNVERWINHYFAFHSVDGWFHVQCSVCRIWWPLFFRSLNPFVWFKDGKIYVRNKALLSNACGIDWGHWCANQIFRYFQSQMFDFLSLKCILNRSTNLNHNFGAEPQSRRDRSNSHHLENNNAFGDWAYFIWTKR